MPILVVVLLLIPIMPLLQAVGLHFANQHNKPHIAGIVSCFSWATLLGSLFVMTTVLLYGRIETGPFLFDRLSGIVLVLISLISLIVNYFSFSYMQADRYYGRYFQKLALLTATLLLFASSGNIVMMSASWLGMSFFMFLLLRHQDLGKASHYSAEKAQKIFWVGDAAFVLGALLFTVITGTTNITHGLASLQGSVAHTGIWLVGLIWILAALTKTANIPFFRWLPNTMASPTTVSAIMHAGFVNSGGILFARFSSLYFHCPDLLFLMFAIGAFTALFGSLVMLVQTDIKRYLAFSTIGQMGFMIMQCGLGAFPAAIFHLIAHSLFKSSLFLGSGSVIQNTRDVILPNPILFSINTPKALSEKKSLFLIISIFLMPIIFAILLQSWTGSKGAACLLLLFPGLAMLPLTKSLLLQKNHSSMISHLVYVTFIGLGLVFCYVIFESTIHFALSPDVQNITTPLSLPHLILISFLLFSGIVSILIYSSGLTKSDTVKNWLYVWFLNQRGSLSTKTLFTHRHAMHLHDD